MIMEHRAGDRLAAPRGRGTPQSPAQQQRSPASLAAQAGRGRWRVTPPVPQGRPRGRAGGAGVTASAGRYGGSPGVAYVDDGLLLLSWQL
jgi:hypothetical protein